MPKVQVTRFIENSKLAIHIISISLIVHLILYTNLNACTVFCFTATDNTYAGKNLDWPIADGYVFINKRGVSKSSFIQEEEKSIKWMSKYGSITFNQLGREFPLGGMNEAGLVIEELSHALGQYPQESSNPKLSELQWIQYQLDNHGCVIEVINSLDTILISRLLFNLHYFVCDTNGDAAVIEFIDGEAKIYADMDLPFNVLSNNNYENSLKYLARHEGYGGVEPIVNGRSGSQERFIRAVALLDKYMENQEPPVKYAFEILENVKQQDTQWTIVYDLRNLGVSFITKSMKIAEDFRLTNFDLTDSGSIQIASLNSPSNPPHFENYTNAKNHILLINVFDQLISTGNLIESEAEIIKRKLINYQNSLE